jgi:hypothetical protein
MKFDTKKRWHMIYDPPSLFQTRTNRTLSVYLCSTKRVQATTYFTMKFYNVSQLTVIVLFILLNFVSFSAGMSLMF